MENVALAIVGHPVFAGDIGAQGKHKALYVNRLNPMYTKTFLELNQT